MKFLFLPAAVGIALSILSVLSFAQTDSFYLLKPDRVFDGDPSTDIKDIRKIVFVMKDGKIYKEIQ